MEHRILYLIAISIQTLAFSRAQTPKNDVETLPTSQWLTTTSLPLTTSSLYSTAVARGEAVVEDFIDRYQTTQLVDLIFVVDRSGSVPSKGWGAITNFIRDILQDFTVDEKNTRVAIVTYSSEASVDINDLEPHYLNNRENKCTLHRRIKNIIEPKIPYGYTSTYAALDKVYEIIQNARSDSKKAVLVLTDGRSNLGPPPVRAAFNILSLQWDLAWDEAVYGPQVEIYAFGIENAYRPELHSIASSLPNHTFFIPSFEAFEGFARSLHGGKQVETWIVERNFSQCGACAGPYASCMCGTKSGEYACVCAPGYERRDGQCVACGFGYYKENYTLEACTLCPENTTTLRQASTEPDQCILKPGMTECPQLEPVPNGYLFYVSGSRLDEISPTDEECVDVMDGNSCHHACDEGYWLDGRPIMVCENTGRWRGTPPVCRVVDCGGPEQLTGLADIDNANLTFLNGTSYGAVTEVTCLDNTVPLGSTSWSCDRHGQWTKPWNFKCARVFCGPVPLSEYMKAAPRACAMTKQEYSTECQLTCSRGFELRGAGSVTCHYDRKPFWAPIHMPTCVDIQAPEITCPDDRDVVVENRGDTAAVVHIDSSNAIVEENSETYTVEVAGVPEGERFLIGHHQLTYTVTDGVSLTASCNQDIHVKGRSAVSASCPPSVIRHTKSELGKLTTVTWADPVFLGPNNESLAHRCSLNAFPIGTTLVECWPKEYEAVKCSFSVIVTKPACEVPHTGAPPGHGALICWRPEDGLHPRKCRVHCKRGYRPDWRHDQDTELTCGWDGDWEGVGDEWPVCVRTRLSSSSHITNEIHMAYRGSCKDDQAHIQRAFTAAMETVIEESGGCDDDVYSCSVTDVNVWCGLQFRRRRDVGTMEDLSESAMYTNAAVTNQSLVTENYPGDLTTGDQLTHQTNDQTTDSVNGESTNGFSSTVPSAFETTSKHLDNVTFGEDIENETLTTYSPASYPLAENQPTTVSTPTDIKITFRINAEILNKSEEEITREDQTNLAFNVLETIYYHINDNSIVLTLTPGESYILDSYEAKLPKFDITCGEGEVFQSVVSTQEDFSQCMSCAPGTYSLNNTCVPCDVGYYQSADGQTACLPCPETTTTTGPGATDVCGCVLEGSVSEAERTSVAVVREESRLQQCYVCSTSNSHNDTCSDPSVERCGPLCIHGDCNNGSYDSVWCTCHEGYTGERCDTRLSTCFNVTCHNNGTCLELGDDAFQCECEPGYLGDHCEQEESACLSDPCFRGYCLESLHGYSCVCDDGWMGRDCDVMTLDCQSNPCHHGNCSQTADDIVCVCEEGYQGALCEYAVDVCEVEPCRNNATCVSLHGGASCVCAPGWTGDLCEEAVDLCLGVTCQHNGTCVGLEDRAMCTCAPGYAGTHCQTAIDSTFDLIFPHGSVTDFVSLRPVTKSLRNVSACLWLRTDDAHRFGTIFSYAVPSDLLCARGPDAFTLYDYGMLRIFVNGDSVNTHYALNDGYWHHMCVTWSSERGTWTMRVNGTLRARGEGLASGTSIEQSGYFIIGQRQVTAGNAYRSRWSFRGELHQLHLYSHVLQDEEIKELAESCEVEQEGDVLPWTSIIGHTSGDVIVRNQTWCLDVNECLRRDACVSEQEHCVDVLDSYSCDVIPEEPCHDVICQHGGDCVVGSDKTVHCVCPSNFTGKFCETPLTCEGLVCENNGTCVDNETVYCDCAPGNHGDRCELTSSDPCGGVICLNGGVCELNEGHDMCKCAGNWRGKHCQTYFTPSCSNTACLHGGTCVLDPASPDGYTCQCTHSNVGPNCELLPCLSDPCHNNGTCHNEADQYECECGPGFTGPNCETEVTTPVPTTTVQVTLEEIKTEKTTTAFISVDYCSSVECQNNGKCHNKVGGFRCECTSDYKGQYCNTKRKSDLRTYLVRVTLLQKYTSSLQYNQTFKEEFSNAVHDVYRAETTDSKLRVDIQGLSEGSVLVDFHLLHTVYSDSSAPGTERMKQVLQEALMRGRLGSLPASLDHFRFMLLDTAGAGLPWWLIVVLAVAAVFILATLVFVVMCCKRRRRHSKPYKLNNFPDEVKTRIRNPVFSESRASPHAIRMQPHVHEDIYAEPMEMPYAVTSFTDFDNLKNESREGSLGRRYPSKQGKDINKDWASSRATMPLPPRPDERGAAPLAAAEATKSSTESGLDQADPRYKRPKPPLKVTPPPTYKDAIAKNLKMSNANINPGDGATGGVMVDDLYITPISDNDDKSQKSSSPRSPLSPSQGQLVPSVSVQGPPGVCRIPSDHDSDEEYLAPDVTTFFGIKSTPNLNQDPSVKDSSKAQMNPKAKSLNDLPATPAADEYMPMSGARSRPGSSADNDYLKRAEAKSKPAENKSDKRNNENEYLSPVNVVKNNDTSNKNESDKSDYLSPVNIDKTKLSSEKTETVTEPTEYLTPVSAQPPHTYMNQQDALS